MYYYITRQVVLIYETFQYIFQECGELRGLCDLEALGAFLQWHSQLVGILAGGGRSYFKQDSRDYQRVTINSSNLTISI